MKLPTFAEHGRHGRLPLDLNDLNKWYAAIPSAQNAAIVYEEAFTNLISADTPAIERLATNLVERIGVLDAEKLREIDLLVTRNRKALDLLHAGAGYPQCRYSLQLRNDSVPAFPHLDGLWTSAQLLALENLDFAAKGHEDKAV